MHYSRSSTGLWLIAFALAAVVFAPAASAHAIGGKDAAFVAATNGPDPFPFIYLGAKQVTGYDRTVSRVALVLLSTG